MSSYHDHKDALPGRVGFTVTHSWAEFTENRLAWLYGPNHAKERAARTQADIASWRRLGTRTAA